jgi:3-hydroxybutyrate dehydrogenase
MGALQDSVAVVTGGTRGVGRGIAEAFLDAGANVVVNGRHAAAGQRCVSELGAGDRAVFYAGDVTRQATVEGLIDFAVERLGGLDVLVLNAGGTHVDRPLAELGDDDWRRLMDLNLSHVFWGMRRALHHMIPRRAGRIIVTSAVEGKLPRPGASAYVAAKHAVNGLVKSVAHEVGPVGITVNAILPSALENSVRRGVASVALMLATPAMTSVTGCMFPVDGGAMPY